ncbi:MAG: LuxR C-terminal-related transcriptional regulator [Acidimicrobiales bacterium]
MTLLVGLANDSELVISGLRAMLAPFAPRVRVAEGVTGDAEIVALPAEAEPIDVLLVDTFGRDDGGLQAAAMLMAQDPPFRVVIYTDSRADRHVLTSLRLGVHGYLLKSTPADQLVDALERVRSGDVVVSEDLASRAARFAASPAESEPWPGARFALTRRESEVLLLAAEGHTTDDLARKLSVGTETIRTHLKHIYQKLGVNVRAAAVAVVCCRVCGGAPWRYLGAHWA